jgi:hypothetical protein
MKNISLIGIVVFAALVLMLDQSAEGIIGDSGIQGQDRGIIINDRILLKQSLLQDVAKINEEIKIMQTKLNKAREGENLAANSIPTSTKNLKALFNSLSTKIKGAQANQKSIGNIQNLSDGSSKGIIIINGLEPKVGANLKSDSLNLLNELSKLMIGLESEINRL